MSKAKYLDTMIGTVADSQTESCHGGVKTYPGAVVPCATTIRSYQI